MVKWRGATAGLWAALSNARQQARLHGAVPTVACLDTLGGCVHGRVGCAHADHWQPGPVDTNEQKTVFRPGHNSI
jgi:hypothetical protein